MTQHAGDSFQSLGVLMANRYYQPPVLHRPNVLFNLVGLLLIVAGIGIPGHKLAGEKRLLEVSVNVET